MEKLPPIEKVYEAWTAIEDGRAQLEDDGNECVVTSSDGTKKYTVIREETPDGVVYKSNDNATYWQGYAGYPVICMLMLEKKVPLDLRVAGWFAHVNWNEVNAAHKGDYAAALQSVIESLDLKKERVDHAAKDAQKVLDALAELDVRVARNGAKPEKLA